MKFAQSENRVSDNGFSMTHLEQELRPEPGTEMAESRDDVSRRKNLKQAFLQMFLRGRGEEEREEEDNEAAEVTQV